MPSSMIRTGKTLVVASLLVVAFSTTALAWIENTTAARETTSGDDGCIKQYQHVHHGGANDKFVVKVSAAVQGFDDDPSSPGVICAQEPDYAKFIKGTLYTFVLKLIEEGTGSNPDTYSICTVRTIEKSTWQWNFSGNYTWSTPPCGPGLYAVASLLDVDTLLTDWEDAWVGKYQGTSNFLTWNVSRWWHPANNSGDVTGPPVKL